jgi:hypothetical protein
MPGAVLIAVVIVLAIGASLATADPGDTPSEGIPLSVPITADATFTAGHTWVDYSLVATAGQTVRITATAGRADGLFVGTYANSKEPYVVLGSKAATDTLALSFMVSRPGTFTVAFVATETGPYSVSTTVTAPVPFKLDNMSAPTSARHSRNFSVSARLYPAYNSVASPIKFIIERKSGKKWKSYSSAKGAFVAQFLGGGSSKTTSTFKLSKKATYRIRARFADVGHASASYSKWKTIRIK